MQGSELRKHNAITKLIVQHQVSYEEAEEMYKQSFRNIGSKGGKATGESKVRGDRQFYSTIGRKGGLAKKK